ncbi:guanosine nucleotide diphosphate dissociation inhibitor 2-like [Zingiber officinale]|uniref:guanosine nucleotide diphosphate dissociation inhibitor 2-like n=1 Tax=Zingiber officinale TaxID=94328 RepID=UPI001C4CC7F4|nr:guanosine nucleotide diphosphate dissociation inhibitor 2-like [Zingiber officinale]
MLNKPECKVEFDREGKACGVTSEGETARCKKVVCDPSCLPNKVRKVGKVARAIAIMIHPIPNTDESHSAQVILPQKQLGRKSDNDLQTLNLSMDLSAASATEEY